MNLKVKGDYRSVGGVCVGVCGGLGVLNGNVPDL
jgi:hypothetical protein